MGGGMPRMHYWQGPVPLPGGRRLGGFAGLRSRHALAGIVARSVRGYSDRGLARIALTSNGRAMKLLYSERGREKPITNRVGGGDGVT